jgi:hypothetical protein
MTDAPLGPTSGMFTSPVGGASGDGAAPEEGATGPDEGTPRPGQLHIRQKRSWRSWQLAATALVALIIGMWLNGSTGGGSASAGSGGSGGHSTLPPAENPSAGTGTSGSTTTTSPRGGAATTTTVAGGGSSSTTTTVAGGSTGPTGTTQALGNESYLVPAYQSSGSWTSPAFDIAGSTWYIGWAFSCSPVPAAKPTFAVYVVPSGASPSGTPAVTSSDPQGQAVTPQSSTGSQSIAVQAPPQCRWVVKVTGYGG